jgi:hypothetical protein
MCSRFLVGDELPYVQSGSSRSGNLRSSLMHSPKKSGRDDKGRKRRQEKRRDERGWDASQDEPDRLLRCKQSKENAKQTLVLTVRRRGFPRMGGGRGMEGIFILQPAAAICDLPWSRPGHVSPCPCPCPSPKGVGRHLDPANARASTGVLPSHLVVVMCTRGGSRHWQTTG